MKKKFFLTYENIILKENVIKNLTQDIFCLLPVCKQLPANIHLLNVSNRNTRKRCEICSKLTITPERCH